MALTPLEFLLLFGFLGAIAAAFAFVFRALVQTKQERITELVAERDYYRSAALIERALPSELHPAALPAPAGTLAVVTPTPKDKTEDAKDDKKPDRFAMYSLLIQAGISIVVLILSFWLIATPTEPTANQVAYQLITFILGVWLGRGVEFATKR